MNVESVTCWFLNDVVISELQSEPFIVALPFVIRMWTSCSCSRMVVWLPCSSSAVRAPSCPAQPAESSVTLSPLTARWRRDLWLALIWVVSPGYGLLCAVWTFVSCQKKKKSAILWPQNKILLSRPPQAHLPMWVVTRASLSTFLRRLQLESPCKRLSSTSTPLRRAEARDSSSGLS